jgi:ubiquinone/menaquinone biosynthesis C-methylase UbiE
MICLLSVREIYIRKRSKCLGTCKVGEIHARLADRLVRVAVPQPNERVLDIATGTGFVAIPVVRLVG